MDSWAFMQLSPFVRCNSHWVRGFFPVDDGETLKDAKITGAYKYMDILHIQPNYTERELKGLSRDQESRRELSENKVWRDHYSKSVPFRHKFAKLVKRRKEQSRDREYVDCAWLRLDIEAWEAAEAEDRAYERARKAATEEYQSPPATYIWHSSDQRTSAPVGRKSNVVLLHEEGIKIRELVNVTEDDCEAVRKIDKLITHRFCVEFNEATNMMEIEAAHRKSLRDYSTIPAVREMVEKGLVDATTGEIYETHL